MKKTLEINNTKFATLEKMYLTPRGFYGVSNAGFGRWVLTDIERNFESDICFFTKKEALLEATKYEAQQILKGFEFDKNKFNQNNLNNEFYNTFGQVAFGTRYY